MSRCLPGPRLRQGVLDQVDCRPSSVAGAAARDVVGAVVGAKVFSYERGNLRGCRLSRCQCVLGFHRQLVRRVELQRDAVGIAEVQVVLILSPKTVEHHLSSVYRKRGFRSRSELAGSFRPPENG
jgi:hypothetical protein